MKRLTAFLLWLTCAPSPAETVTLLPSKNSDVYSYTGGGNGAPTSTDATLGVNSTPSGYATLHSQKSLIQFNLSTLSIPATEIATAVLRLFVLEPDPAFGTLSPGDVHVHRQATDWGAVTAASPNWHSFQSAGVLGTIPIGSGSAGTWVELDLTATVAGWKAGSFANYGVFLAPREDRMSPSLNVVFAAMKVNGYQPRIVVTRKIPVPALTIQANGGAVTLRWPVTGSEGWVLERADSPAGPWAANTASVSAVAGQWQLQPAAGLAREFFRLAKY